MENNRPLYYHLHHVHSSEDLPFWFDLARRQSGPILELGCGTGRVLLPLLERGYSVCGLDRDALMLQFLRSLPRPEPQPLLLIQADMTRFHFSIKFPLIILPCNTLSTLDAAQRRALFERISRHLTDEGIFAAVLPNPRLLLQLPPEADPEEEDHFFLENGDPVQVSSAWQRSEQSFRLLWLYDHLLPDGHVQRTQVETRHFLAPSEDYLAALNEAGLIPEAQYGDFDHSAYSVESPSFIILARKKTVSEKT